jgi:hypothetical protein
MKTLRWMAEAISTVALLVVYALLVVPVGVIARALGRNALRHKSAGGGFWQKHQGVGDRGAMEKQS